MKEQSRTGVAPTADFAKGRFAVTQDRTTCTIAFDGKGNYVATMNNEVAVEGTYTVTGDGRVFTDEKGLRTGRGDEETARYRWKLDGNELVLTVVKDKPQDRKAAATSRPWTTLGLILAVVRLAHSPLA